MTYSHLNGAYINHQWFNQNSNTISVKNKETGELLSEVSLLEKDQLDSAIDGSVSAFKEMRNWSAGKRYDMLEVLIQKFKAKKDEFATLISLEAGKPISYAKAEVARCLSTLEFAKEETRRICGEVVPMDFAAGAGKTAFTKRVAKGVLTCVSPFNFPLNLALHKIAPALAVGSSVVLKPSPYTPLSSLMFAELLNEVGYPEGALNVVVCDNDVAQMLVEDERAKVFSFTGSPQIGWMLKSLAGKKKVILELGGNAACLIDESADLEKAAKDLAVGCYLYSGQICISTQRIFVQQSVQKKFQDLLLKEIETIQCGSLSDESVIVGPLIDRVHFDRIDSWVKEAIEKGASVLVGAKAFDEKRNIYAPTLLTNVSKDAKVYQEEVFGPVALISTFDSIEEGFDLVNDSRFGLQCGFYTNNLSHFKKAHDTLDVGAIIMNGAPGFRIDSMPYGGVKDSGLGREGLKYCIFEITEPRLVIF
ncbi:aldehyde dehydrogenase family protein [Halobacteriovorax sp. GB3]|uniref:aldehyde dehydrogenase family protein n=1 Tax=Halobacteriovorax sp. GB3 TaxID=2719615 RepID=UPI002361E026|nr:aldehyde dehydrogenase family protein [Halobacteriovorax sp. GB3]MDD0852084.1 aldehyde dehydrogenase family protein [Halobacteriovorax sp. GB3]